MGHSSKVVDLNVYPSYRGGDTLVAGNYVCEYLPQHPLANIWGFVAQHRVIGEDLIGRPLVRGGPLAECVHHKNEDKRDNRPENLEVMTRSGHQKHHADELNQRRELALSPSTVERGLKEHGGVFGLAKALGVHHQTLRNRFPELVKPYLRSSPSDLSDTVYQERLVEVARYFAPTEISYLELSRFKKVF